MLNPCNSHLAVSFVAKYVEKAAKVAEKLDIPTENILGLAAHECEHGKGRFADKGNNFFSMHAPAPHQIGTITAKGDPKVKMAVYANFEMAAQSFVDRFGNGVRGKKDAGEFSRALVTIGFNSGKSSNGGRDGYAKFVEDAIRMVRLIMECR